MGSTDVLIHLANFAAPALFLALLLAGCARLFGQKEAAVRSAWAQVAINFVAGLGVLGAGLWLFGRDGKMVTYAALVVVMASIQWVSSRAWR